MMDIPNRNPRIFVPGKIIQVRSQKNPLVVSKLVLISVEEHIRHVDEMLIWLYPDATDVQRAAARLHDVGKKVRARWEFLKGLKLDTDKLRADFYRIDGAGDAFLSCQQSGDRYLAFVQAGPHRRLWPIYNDAGELKDVRMDVDPPFGNHAADASDYDVRFYKNGALDLESNREDRDYVLNLVHLHHSFQPDRIISACAQHGGGMVTDLYRLIVADHMGSRWAEYIVQQLEGGLEKLEREDFFGDVKVSVVVEPEIQSNHDSVISGKVRVRRDPGLSEQGPPAEKELTVRYYPVEVNWNLGELVQEAARPKVRSAQKTRRDKRRRS